MPMPFVSVVVPIYNGEADLPDLLTCLWHQTYPADRVEYVLVDNNSGDRTSALLEDSVQTSRDRGICLRALCEADIQSSYAARNTGIKATTGEIIAFTDADCRPQPDWLEQLIRPFAEPMVGIVAGEVVALPSRNALERYADRQETLSQKHTLAHSFYPYGQTANLAIHRQALKTVGLFRPYLTTGGDADLCWRIQQETAWQIRFADQSIVKHRHRSTLAELRHQWTRYGQSNRYLYELHGIALMRELTLRENLHRWSRWLLKEVPIIGIRMVTRQTTVDALLDTPLGLFCAHTRSLGQRQARLTENARQIDWLPDHATNLSIDSPR
ncbi:MAG: glycosyltransferase [Elainellaceae cyanobacterium]